MSLEQLSIYSVKVHISFCFMRKLINFVYRRLFHYCKTMSQVIKFSDYDVVSFDLDNTLLEYNLSKLYELQYDFLSNYMVEKKGYCRSVFPFELTKEDADFIQRGLFLDFKRGNILYLRNDGYIVKACHGTKLMNEDVVEYVYGLDRKWSITNAIINDKQLLWDNCDTRTFLDFTDSIGVLIFAKAVDSVDIQGSVSSYNVWPDVLESVVEMYKYDNNFLKTCISNPIAYAFPCNDIVISWLRQIKEKSKLLLITGADPKIINSSLMLCFGKNFFEIFDIIICEAKKPGFFSMNRPFLTMDGKLMHELPINIFCNHTIYRQGNWRTLLESFEKALGRKPKSLYIGDNPIQDIYTPTQIPLKLDTVAVIEEIAGEGLHPDCLGYPHSHIVASKFWGPFLHSTSGFSFIGGLIRDHAKLIVPSVKVLAKHPIDYEHKNIDF